ncbi:hypothetical protein GCM10011507_01940 [Edaphobacter acidisoli]|uniref:DUF4136 domain-containing protein n=1 Tax=Edaphobacter acidisoli TaxID=2040573 RepID=A0A916RE27_9BACT|nr:hypothetical protein [Edaphobacter acidisoli]GGA54302.1 hypothetical protein GCM10011507_01940 [Edaphobacter acidisoli]
MKPFIRRSGVFFASISALALTIATGCAPSKSAPTPENFSKAINAYFLDHHECLLSNIRFPYETTDKTETRQLDSLVKSLLLNKNEEPAIHSSRYTVAPAGQRYAPRFCYGNREVTSIDSSTPLSVVNGFKQSTVTYHYTITEVPVWAKTPEVLAAFPQMAQAINDSNTAKITLDQTTTSWQVPD